jgi:S-formylglutathione hydrolase FrmB
MNKIKLLSTLLTVFMLAASSGIRAGVVDTIITYSPSMNKDIKSIVILPDSYADTTKTFPVLYLLHGHSGDYSSWSKMAPQLSSLVDTYQMIIVCADGGKRSWYLDSPVDTSFRYETYIMRELIPDIDTRYRTDTVREKRGITGLSMGGHGGLFLGIKHRDMFGAAGSMSGGLDLLQKTASWKDKQRILGDTATFKHNWQIHSVIDIVNTLKDGDIKLMIDCGIDDYFIGINRAVREKLLQMKIAHDYIERPGGHNADYWRNSVNYQLLFFHLYFQSNTLER